MENLVELRTEPLIQKSTDSAHPHFAEEVWDNIKQHKSDILIGVAALGAVAAGSVGVRALVRAMDNGTRNLARFTGAEESPFLRPFLGQPDHHIPNLGTFKENTLGKVSTDSLAAKSEPQLDLGPGKNPTVTPYTEADHDALWEGLAKFHKPLRWDGAHLNYGPIAEMEGFEKSTEKLWKGGTTTAPNSSLDPISHELSHEVLPGLSRLRDADRYTETWLSSDQPGAFQTGADKSGIDSATIHLMPPIGDSAEQDKIHALMTLAHEVPHWQAAGRANDKTFLVFIDDLIVQNGLSKSVVPQLKK